MRKIMKNTMLLVIFSFVLTFGATLASASVADPVASDGQSSQEKSLIFDAFGVPVSGNEGDPDGYKEGWDNEDPAEGGGPCDGNWDFPWDDFFFVWMILGNQYPF